jgi:hypothetical protein
LGKDQEKNMFLQRIGKVGLALVLTCGASSLARASTDDVKTAVKKVASDAKDAGRAVKNKTSEVVQEGAAVVKKKAKSAKKAIVKAAEKTKDAAKDAIGK